MSLTLVFGLALLAYLGYRRIFVGGTWARDDTALVYATSGMFVGSVGMMLIRRLRGK